jgi:HSP20 family molecular chaperone IbpA
VLPAEATGGYFAHWAERERAELAEIEAAFPVPRYTAPLHPHEPIGVDALRALGHETYGDRDPAGLFVRRRPLRLERRGSNTLLSIDLPTARGEEIDVSVLGDELHVGVRDVRRRIALPTSLVGLTVASAKLLEGVLEIELTR